MVVEQCRVGSPCDEDVTGLQLQELPLTTANGTILCDVSTTFYRHFEPPFLHRKVFSSLHNLSHPGSRATEKLVSDRVVWPGMHKDLKACTRTCLGCQRNKDQRHNKAHIGTFPTPDTRLSHVRSDIVGPYLCSKAVPISLPAWIDSPGGWKLFRSSGNSQSPNTLYQVIPV
ncbi:hypothetical protein SprV_0602169600 [Sparganum proliferum]